MRAFACLTKFPRRVLSCVDNQDLVTVVLEKSRLWIVRRRRRPAVLKRLRMRTNVLRLGCPTSIEIRQRHWILSLDWIMSESEAVTSMINVLEELQFLVILADHHLIWGCKNVVRIKFSTVKRKINSFTDQVVKTQQLAWKCMHCESFVLRTSDVICLKQYLWNMNHKVPIGLVQVKLWRTSTLENSTDAMRTNEVSSQVTDFTYALWNNLFSNLSSRLCHWSVLTAAWRKSGESILKHRDFISHAFTDMLQSLRDCPRHLCREVKGIVLVVKVFQ